MQAIRSILWVGPEAGLIRNGLLEAKSLDVVWAPDAETALDLPVENFETAVLALEKFEIQREAVAKFSERSDTPPLVVLAPASMADHLRESIPVGGGEIVPASLPSSVR